MSAHDFMVKAVKKMRRNPTLAESAMISKLEELEVKYVFQARWTYNTKPIRNKKGVIQKESQGFKGICDFWLPEQNVFVEVDGGYHNTEAQKQKDAIRDWVLAEKLGRSIVHFTNKQVLELPAEHLLAKIKEYGGNSKKCIDCSSGDECANGTGDWITGSPRSTMDNAGRANQLAPALVCSQEPIAL